MSTTFEHWKIDGLKNHHLNAEVFGELSGDSDLDAFVQSVKDDGVIVPLVVVPDGPQKVTGTIIAGHRRRQAAARAGLKEVPVIVRRDLKTALDIDRVWFETNRNREMTTEQKARWFKKREEIESKAAKSKQKTGKALDLTANVPQGQRAPTAADVAAAEVGMGRKTATAAAKVVDAIDEAAATGDKQTAARLRETLNNGSVAAAKREADKLSGKPKRRKGKPNRPPAKVELKKLDQAVGAVSRALVKASKVHGEGAHYRSIFESIKEIKQTIAEWASA